MDYFKRIEEAQKIIASTQHLDVSFFDSKLTDADYKTFYAAGYWDHLLLGKDEYNNFYALRIIPEQNIQQWPVIESRKLRESTMYASSLSAHSIKHFSNANNSKKNFLTYNQTYTKIKKRLTPVYEMLQIEDSLTAYLEYIGDMNNCPTWESDGPRENIDLSYTSFYKKLDQSEAHTKYREMVASLMSSETNIPSIPNDNYGVWQPSMYKYIADRATMNYFDQEIPDFANIIWRSFTECHSYDNKDNFISQRSGTGGMPSPFYSSVVSFLVNFPNDFPQEMKNHPLMEAAKKMPFPGSEHEIYTGATHLKAASILDKEFNDAKGCWNALTNHSFWLGKSFRNREALGLQHMTVKQALSLAEENNWKDAAYALRQTADRYSKWL